MGRNGVKIVKSRKSAEERLAMLQCLAEGGGEDEAALGTKRGRSEESDAGDAGDAGEAGEASPSPKRSKVVVTKETDEDEISLPSDVEG